MRQERNTNTWQPNNPLNSLSCYLVWAVVERSIVVVVAVADSNRPVVVVDLADNIRLVEDLVDCSLRSFVVGSLAAAVVRNL